MKVKGTGSLRMFEEYVKDNHMQGFIQLQLLQ